MSDPVWYRSLYWRIGFGFVAVLAAVLLAQGVVFLWLTDRIVGGSSRSPEQLAKVVASELSSAMSADPSLALEPHVLDRFGHIYQPFLVALRDGRIASNRPRALPPNFARVQAGRVKARATFERSEAGSRSESAAVMVGGAEIGRVVVPVNPPPAFVAIRELGPTLTWAAVGLLIAGAATAAMLIFGPVHRRLRLLEQAATALGQGRVEVRAVEAGGDEVSSLARTFNRMADDLAARAAALAISDQSRRQLLADVSHELMTPLAAIRGYTETLAMPELDLDVASRARYLAIVGEETEKLEALIGDLLDLARLEGGGSAFVFERVPVAELFSRVADRHGPALRERRVALVSTIEPPTLTLRADPQRLEQALQNLAANAIRHTPDGGRVTLGATADDDRIRLVVRDTGPGIAAQHLPHVFERFYKADAARTAGASSGSGLGLSIVKAIVKRHGGEIVVDNAPGGGAEFAISLPIRPRPTSD